MTAKVSILGLGKMGLNHLRTLSLLKEVKIQYIFDSNEDVLKQLSLQYDVPYTTDLDRAIEGCDAVYIVTPTVTHFNYFQKCSPKVKNIFIEKPLTASYKEALELEKIAKKNNNFIQCGFVERFNPAFICLEKILEAHKVINIDFIRTNKLSSRITDVDVVLDLMIHDIDLALCLNGPVKNIYSFGAKEHNKIAFCNATLEHQNGSLSRLLASRITEKKIRSLAVTTYDNFIEVELLKKTLIVHQQSEIIENNEKSYQINSVQKEVEVGYQEALLTENRAFIDNCKKRTEEVIPDLESSVLVLKVAQEIIHNIKL